MGNTVILGIRDEVDESWRLKTPHAFTLTGFNTGNLAFQYATNRILGGGQAFYPWNHSAQAMDELGATIVLPLANHLGPHANFGGFGAHLSHIRSPIVVVGLGAQAEPDYDGIPEVPEGSREWIRQMIAHAPTDAPNIGVRGEYSLKVLAHYGLAEKAIVTGCPSLFINPSPKLGQQIAERARRPLTRIAVAGGHQGWTGLGRIEASLARLIIATGGSYIVQAPVQLVHLARGEAERLSEPDLVACRDYLLPGMDVDIFKGWARQFFRVFFNVSEWMEYLRAHDFVVGTRIHGIVLGLQAGIPGLCIAHDSRTRELCETMLVPFVMARDVMDGITLETLRDHWVFDAEKFDANRAAMAGRFDRFLADNGIDGGGRLRGISGGA